MQLNAFMAAVELIPNSRPKPVVPFGWHPINLIGPFERSFERELCDWVRDEIKGDWRWSPYLGMGQTLGLHFQFEERNDALLFKISWGGLKEAVQVPL